MPDWAARQYGFDADRLADASDPDGAADRERARLEEAEQGALNAASSSL